MKKQRTKRYKYGFETYTQSTTVHTQEYMIALNNRFPNLVGYGCIQYLKELMANTEYGKVVWDDDNIKAMCAMMNIEETLFREIVDFSINSLGLLKFTRSWYNFEFTEVRFLTCPPFLEELVTLQSKRILAKAEKWRNKERFNKDNETTYKKKKRMISEMMQFLVFTEKMQGDCKKFYPHIEDPNKYWEDFLTMCEESYYEWHAKLNPENYANMFFVYMNNQVEEFVIEKDEDEE